MLTYTWYLCPKDDHTNEVFARSLPEEDSIQSQLCSDRKKRSLWRCDYQFVNRIKGSATLRYEVFVQEGNGQIRPWIIPPKKKHKLVSASQLRPRY